MILLIRKLTSKHIENQLIVSENKITMKIMESSFFNYFLIEGQLFYRILLFSVRHQHESAIGIYMSPPFWSSLRSPYLSHPSRLIQNPCLNSVRCTANPHWLSVLHMVMQVSMLLSPYISPSPCVHRSVLSVSVSPLLPCK